MPVLRAFKMLLTSFAECSLSVREKRKKISAVLQNTYSGQRWPGRLEMISFDKVSSKRTAKIPQPLVRNLKKKKIPGFVPASKPVAICMVPVHRLTFAIHTGLRLFLKFLCVDNASCI